MVHPSTFETLRAKMLPTGAIPIVNMLAEHADRVEITHAVMERVPLIAIGQSGMIARLPMAGRLQKYAKPFDIARALRGFFTRDETVYLYLNLPDLAVPRHVRQVIAEVTRRAEQRDSLLLRIDEALDAGDKDGFFELTQKLHRLSDGAAIAGLAEKDAD